MIIFIDQERLHRILKAGNNLLLITFDFSGHRIDWLQQLRAEVERQGKSLLVICQDSSRLQEELSLLQKNQKDIYIYEVNSIKVRKISELLLECESPTNTLAIWDADMFLWDLLKCRYSCNALFMRPYRTSDSIQSAVRYLLKILFILYLKIFSKHSLGLLSIPGAQNRFLSKNWIDDEVFFRKIRDDQDLRIHQETVRILVPGYISSRKNPHWIVEACELLRSQGYGNFTLAFDGIIASDQIDYLMSKKSDWLSVHDGYKTLENFKASLRDAHLVLLPYNNRGSSGIVIHSLLMGNYVAISKSRAWKNLSRTSRGKLKLMCHSSEGVYIATKEWLDLEYKNYDSLDPFSEGKVSVIDFLTQKSTKEPGS